MPISDTISPATQLVVPLEWTRQLSIALHMAEGLLREHAVDQSYAKDGAPNAHARAWHDNQRIGSLEAAESLAAWRGRLASRPMHRPNSKRLSNALAATADAAEALNEALGALRPSPATQRRSA